MRPQISSQGTSKYQKNKIKLNLKIVGWGEKTKAEVYETETKRPTQNQTFGSSGRICKDDKKKKVGTLNKRTPHTDEADAQMSAEVRGHVMKKTTLTNKFRV